MEQRIGTAQLNEALREWIDYNPLPYVSGKGLKVKYLTPG
jgi:predicted GTPase